MNLYRYISSSIAKSRKTRFLRFARLVSLLSVMLGVVALLISLAILHGFENELRNNTTKFTSHIVVFSYNKDPIGNAKAITEQICAKFDAISAIHPVIEGEGLVRAAGFVDGVMFRTYNPEYDPNGFSNLINGQKNFSCDSANEVIVGEPLLRKLALKIGDFVNLYSISIKDNATKYKINKFKIVGTYKTGMTIYDETLVLLPEATARNFYGLPLYSANKIEIFIKDINKASDVSQSIMKFLGFPFWTLTYYEIHSSLFAWIELQREPIPLVLGIISLVAMLNIITTLIITVIEKTRTIGILRTLGISKTGIIKIFAYQGLQIGLYGIVAGCVLSFMFCVLQQQFRFIHLKSEIYFLDALPIFISPLHYVLVASITFVLVLLASVLPALIAAKIKPVSALRFK